MNKKLIKVLTITGLFALLSGISACGGNNSGDKGSGDGDGSGDGPAVSNVEINFWHTFGQTIQDNLNPQLRKFEEQILKTEGVKVTINTVPFSNYDTIWSDISSGLKVGDVPTIAVCYPDHVADYLYQEGSEVGKYVVDLSQYFNDSKVGFGKEKHLGDVEGDSVDDFVENYMIAGSSYMRKGVYSMPYMKSSEALIYNFDAVTAVLDHYKPEFHGSKDAIQTYMNNLDWAEFMELCRQTITYKAEINPDLQTPAFYDSDSNMLISQMYQSGIAYSSLVDNDKGGKSGHIDFELGEDRANLESLLTDLKDYYDEGLFTTKGLYSTYGSDSFKNIEVVYQISSTGGTGYSYSTDFEIGVAKVPPMVADNPAYVCQGPDLCVLRNPKLSDTANQSRALYAWKLIKFLTNAKNNCDICLKGSEGYLPVRTSAYGQNSYLKFINSGEFAADVAILVTQTLNNYYYNAPSFPGSTNLRKEMAGILTMSLTKGNPSYYIDVAIDNAVKVIK